MEPALFDADRVLVNRLAYLMGRPRPGEIVLARAPRVRGEVIKRVGSLPAPAGRDAERFLLLGDTRPLSTDSRHFGALPRRAIRGRVWYRYWPPDRRGRLRPYRP
jgi:signal peptidase I